MFRSLCCDCVATIRPSIPTTSLGLTLLPICSVCCCVTATVTHQLVMLADSELTSFLPVVLTGWIPSLSTPSALRPISMPFQLRALHEPRHLSVGHGVITATAYSPPLLPLCIQYIQPTCRDFTLARPSAFVEGEGFEPPCFGFKPCSLATQTPLSQPPCSVCRYVIATSSSLQQSSALSGAADTPTASHVSHRCRPRLQSSPSVTSTRSSPASSVRTSQSAGTVPFP